MQYIHFFHENRKEIEAIYDNNITIEEIIKFFIIFTQYEQFYNTSKSDFFLYNDFFTSFNRDDFENLLKYSNISPLILNYFFKELSEDESRKLKYFTASLEEDFYFGIKTDNLIFTNRSRYPIDDFYKFIIRHEKMIKKKDIFTENFTFKILSDFFNIKGINFIMINVFINIFDEDGFEQDIIIRWKNTIISVECKSEIFKEPFRDIDKSSIRLKRNFKTSILSAYKQNKRIYENIKNDKTRYFDSDKHSKKVILDINEKFFIPIVITLDNYINLASSIKDFIDVTDSYPYVTDIFSLHTILDFCIVHFHNSKDTLKYGSYQDLFIDYIMSRKDLRDIRSMNFEELDYLGAFIDGFSFEQLSEMNKDAEIQLSNDFSHSIVEHINKYQPLLFCGYFNTQKDFLKDNSFISIDYL